MAYITPSILSKELTLEEVKKLCKERKRWWLLDKINNNPPPTPFITDGCTMWFDEWGDKSLLEACLFHDMAYWVGGTEADRLKADTRLKIDLELVGLDLMAIIMYRAVRLGGLPHFNGTIEDAWGYGWNTEEWVIDE